MKALRGNSHLVWLGLAILIILGEGVAFYRTWDRFASFRGAFDHSRNVLAGTSDLMADIRDAERGQRGFLITGRDDYLRPYRAAAERIPGRLRALRALTEGDPRQQARFAALEPMVANKLAELRETVDLRRRQGFANAAAVVETDRGLRSMREIQALVSEIQAEENQALGRATRGSTDALDLNLAIVTAGSLILLGLVAAGAVFIHRDISRRARLMEVTEHQARIIHFAHEAFMMRDMERRLLTWNLGASELYGWSEDEVKGRSIHDVLKSRLPISLTDLYEALERDGSWEGEVVQTTSDGREIVVDCRQILVRGPDRKPMAVLELNRDVTSRKEAERALEESRERLELVLDSVEVGLFYRDLPSQKLYWNDKCKQHFGVAADQEVTVPLFYERVHPEDRDMVRQAVGDAIANHTSFNIVYRALPPGGPVRWIRSMGRGFYDGSGAPVRFDGITLDITAAHRAEDDLRASRERLQAALDASGMGTFRWYVTTGALEFDAKLDRIFGMPPGQTVRDLAALEELLYGEDRQRVAQAMSRAVREGSDIEIEYRIVWPDQSLHWISVKGRMSRDAGGRPVYVTGACVDISAQKRQEEQLRQTQKLESVGLLAGGIAHDFNNLLVGILGNASLAAETFALEPEDRQVLQEVIRASERAADLTRQLLAYAGKGRFYLEHVNLSEQVRDIVRLVQVTVPKKVRIDLDLAEVPPIEADRVQMQQIIMNLVINAAEAIGEDRPGTVRVTTAARVIDEAYARTLSPDDVAPGEYVELEVQDNGSGMAPATLARIFDPFFTTKFAGRGLGLAAVQGIVRGHKGALRVYSTPGTGTVFKILLPANGRKEHPAACEEAGTDLRGEGLVLVIDDELVVRATAKTALERHGFSVLLAEDGQKGVDLFERDAERIGAVLLDLTMPVMSGEEALARLQAIRPGVAVVLSSGFNKVSAIRSFTDRRLAGFIQKPYTAAQLVMAVKSAMDARRANSA